MFRKENDTFFKEDTSLTCIIPVGYGQRDGHKDEEDEEDKEDEEDEEDEEDAFYYCQYQFQYRQ